MIKVDVISGFLGAGKTTLIKRMYAHAFQHEQVVLIENEFGQVGIDGAFLKEAGIEIKEINSGCICCTLVGDFNKSLEEIIERFHPDRIIIEPSGVGKLSDIIDSIQRFGSLELNIVATVVDAAKCRMYMLNFGEFYEDQIKQANTLVISKGDLAGPAKLQSAIELVRSLNDHANLVTTSLEELDSAQLLATLESDRHLMDVLMEQVRTAAEEHHHHHHHDHDCGCGHHDEEEHECRCGHHHDEDHECHHHHDEDHECHHHHDEGHDCGCHHHDHDEEHECCCGHHHDEDHECHHHHHDEEHECGCHGHAHHHDADEVFVSWGLETARACTAESLSQLLQKLCQTDYGFVLRAKGILKAADQKDWYYFDLVAGDYEIRTGAPDVIGRVCVIGTDLDQSGLDQLFKSL
ncbi:MAG: GTP-binding protein [Clostridia bacterium]|nr:GTP-binding protein [Clostridia bacterium]